MHPKIHHCIQTTIIIAITILLNPLAKAEQKQVVLLHTNDIESVYEPIEAIWRDDIEFIGGIPHLASLIEQVRSQSPTSFLFDAGDIYTGALSKKTQGKLPFSLYSAMGYDAMTLGNHEFEYGWESLLATIPSANFPVLNANIIYQATGKLLAKPYAIVEHDGIKIGVVGVMGIDAFYNTTAKFQRVGLSIKDPTESAQYWVNKIRDKVNMIVVLTHQNKTAPMQTNKESDPTVQRGFDEDYAMAGKLKHVDVIFGGHSDNGLMAPVVHPKTGIVVGLTFGQGMHLGYTRFNVDTKGHNVAFIDGKLIAVDAGKVAREKVTSALISQARSQHPELTENLAVIESAAMRRYNQESTIGNLLTDMMRNQSGADIAMLNSGAIRADINAGIITKEDLINVYPFVDKLTTVKLTGKQVLALVEYSCTLPYGIGQFSGLTLVYSPSLPAMSKVKEVLVNGKQIDLHASYTVSTTGFVAAGGDGYTVFPQGKLVDDTYYMADALISELKSRQQIMLPALGRQRVLE